MAIILPPETADKLFGWLRVRKLQGVTFEGPQRQDNDVNQLSGNLVERLEQTRRIIADLEILYGIIEVDMGVAAEKIKHCKNRRSIVVFARAVVCFILHLRYDLSTPKIAQIIGAKSHATVILNLRKFKTNRINREMYKQADMLAVFINAKKRFRSGAGRGD